MPNPEFYLLSRHSLVPRKDIRNLYDGLNQWLFEESGKTSILRHLSVAKDDKEIADCWRAYWSHTKKNAMWILTDLFSQGARKLDDFLPMFLDDAEHPQLLDQVKQISLYTARA
jgi:AbiV family abortive infection protein